MNMCILSPKLKHLALAPLHFAGVLCGMGAVAPGQMTAATLHEATFEELANIAITSISKQEESYFSAAASVHVITSEAIRRSGALTVPQVLRLAPGMEVGMVNSRSALVTIRGFNGSAANKLLPLIDGRSLYSQRFASTIWDIRDLPLEDVEQIEVIGGPGGTAWGANAVNGVINIITKSAWATPGDLWVAGAGTFEQGFLYARHGFAAGEQGAARVYLKAFQRNDSEPINLKNNNDAWSQVRTGFRYDRKGANGTQMMWTGDLFYSDADQLIAGQPDVAHSSGGHVLAKHRLPLASGRELVLQGYIDVVRRDSGGNLTEADVLDFDVVNRSTRSERLALSWGATYRLSRLEDRVNPATGFVANFNPEERYFNQGSLFLEGRHQSASGRTTQTAGVKAEYNDFTQVELMPSVRSSWLVSEDCTLWAAWSRAARIPSRFENDQFLSFASPSSLNRTLPSPDLKAEILNAFEVGWRWRSPQGLTADVNLFYHDYSGLVTNYYTPIINPVGTDAHLENLGAGTSRGMEAQLTWRPFDWWQLQFAYTYLDLELRLPLGNADPIFLSLATLSPSYQGSLRSSWNLGSRWEVDAWFRAVAKLPQPSREIPAYQELDLRFSRRFGQGWNVAIVGQNLLKPSHREFRFSPTQAAIARGFYLRFEKSH